MAQLSQQQADALAAWRTLPKQTRAEVARWARGPGDPPIAEIHEIAIRWARTVTAIHANRKRRRHIVYDLAYNGFLWLLAWWGGPAGGGRSASAVRDSRLAKRVLQRQAEEA